MRRQRDSVNTIPDKGTEIQEELKYIVMMNQLQSGVNECPW